ncbi:MAG: TetR/AcrR family transcriptional regulator [Clostridia bacterium]|nr:TetR/AcrR family transcriptional regulator [Clostridia bacterium]MBR2919112.1 TetR/AcrR family transcriptional regulator [Clostridia bacterium]
MNTPNNARSAQSKVKIKKAFTALLEAHSVDDITVGEICKEAGVNRTTFYSHYSCMADLYKAIEEDMYVSIKEMLLPTDDISDERAAIKLVVTALEAIKAHRHLHRNHLEHTLEFDYLDELTESIRARYMPLILQGQNLSPEQEEHFFIFCKSGIIGIIRDWVQKDCVADVQSIAHSILFIMHQIRFKLIYN